MTPITFCWWRPFSCKLLKISFFVYVAGSAALWEYKLAYWSDAPLFSLFTGKKGISEYFFLCPSPEQKLTSDSIQAWQHSRPNQSPNTNCRRMNRNGFKSQFLLLSAPNLLIAFPFLSPPPPHPTPPPPLLSSAEFCETTAISGNLQSKAQLDSCPPWRECAPDGVCEDMGEGSCLHPESLNKGCLRGKWGLSKIWQWAELVWQSVDYLDLNWVWGLFRVTMVTSIHLLLSATHFES